jgi:hypothetical protein
MQTLLNHLFQDATSKPRDFKSTVQHDVSRESEPRVWDGALEKGGQVTDLPLHRTVFRRGGSVTHPLAHIGDLI